MILTLELVNKGSLCAHNAVHLVMCLLSPANTDAMLDLLHV